MIKRFESYNDDDLWINPHTSNDDFLALDNVIKEKCPDRKIHKTGWKFDYKGHAIIVSQLTRSRWDLGSVLIDSRVSNIKDLWPETLFKEIDHAIDMVNREKEKERAIALKRSRLKEVNSEDLEMIFQDLRDLNNVKDFQINASNWDFSIRINFIYESFPHKSDYFKNQIDFYQTFEKSILQIESIYDDFSVSLNPFRPVLNSYRNTQWEIRMKLKDDLVSTWTKYTI